MAKAKTFRRNTAVVTVSDKGAAGEREDRSGAVVSELLEGAGFEILSRRIIPDDRDRLEQLLNELCDECVSLIVTTGGTGISPRDVTPEATMAVIDKEIPGMAEAMRAESLKVTPHAMISRAVCGLKGKSIIINLPGSPKAARECLDVVMPALGHAMDMVAGDASECAQMREKTT
ncbi:MAG: MogA/MoaB family molybdenum cofactor biosynthesis protein [Actinobacteria bacterium]|nr:MogA/MoaB family molybdenum cofactor biosynthesis protein [Actinomycetota bacterium]